MANAGGRVGSEGLGTPAAARVQSRARTGLRNEQGFVQFAPEYESLRLLPKLQSGCVRVYLVRHGEVFNPRGVVYGRIPGFELSKAGMAMAKRTAGEVVESIARDREADRRAVEIIVSPLIRTKQSAHFILDLLVQKGLYTWSADWADVCKEGLIEPWSVFEGSVVRNKLLNPANWWHLRRPSVPSWGEPFADVFARFYAQVWQAATKPGVGSVVVVSHQSPIWLMHLWASGQSLAHVPSRRRCGLSSVTVLDFCAHQVGPEGLAPVGQESVPRSAGASDAGRSFGVHKTLWNEVGYFACI